MFDYSLYLVTDRRLSLGRSTVEVVAAAVAPILAIALCAK